MGSYAEYLVNKMIATLVRHTDKNSKLAYQICSGFEQNFIDGINDAGFEFPQKTRRENKSAYTGAASGTAVNTDDWESIRRFTEEKANMLAPEESIFAQNIKKLQPHLSLTDIEVDALIYIEAIDRADESRKNFINDLVRGAPERVPAFIALAMGKKEQAEAVAKAISPTGKLVSYGFIDYEQNHYRNESSLPGIEDEIKTSLAEPVFDYKSLTEQIVGKPVQTDLTISENFRYIEKKARNVANILKSAKAKGLKGMNIVLHGPAGVGKTAFAKAIAKEAGLPAYAIGEDEESNKTELLNQMDSMKRLTRLRQAQTFLGSSCNALCIIDEVEDLLVKGEDSTKAADTRSKILLNRTLEDNEVPTIWIGNDIEKFHTAVRQRFKIVFSLGYQPTLIRQDIWRYHLEKNGLSLSDEDTLKLARKYEAPPRVIEHACEIASLCGGGFQVLCEQIEEKAALECSGHSDGYNSSCPVPEIYDLDLLCADTDLGNELAAFALASQNEQPVSFLIEGPRRVGKSSLAHYFAEQSTRHAVSFDMGELVRPTTGTEPVDHITMAFAEASTRDAVLVLENLQKLFTFAAEDDREKMIDRFMKHMDTHKAPIVLIGARSEREVPPAFRTFIDRHIGLSPATGDNLRKASQLFLGQQISGDMPVAIGDLSLAGRSLSRTGLSNDNHALHMRIKAAARLAAPDAATAGF